MFHRIIYLEGQMSKIETSIFQDDTLSLLFLSVLTQKRREATNASLLFLLPLIADLEFSSTDFQINFH